MRLIFTLSLISVWSVLSAQELPVYNQYVFDPYLINPSYIGHTGFSEVNLLYRSQWTGATDAPRTIAANFQYVANPRIALGLSVYNQEVVLLSSTSFMATFGYRIPINRNNIVSFGLSAGGFSNRIDLTEVPPEDLNDPVFAQADNSIKMDGQFGINYTHKKLTLGFALLRLFDTDAFTSEEEGSGIKFSEFDDMGVSASYLFNLGSNFEFLPFAMYRFGEDYNYFEATGVLSYKKLISLGGFYRQDYGAGFLVRFRVGARIEVGYAHEFAGAQSQSYTAGSHEAQIKMRVGKKAPDLVTKAEERTIDSTATQKTAVAVPAQPEKQQEPAPEVTPVVVAPVVIATQAAPQQPVEEKPVTVEEPPKPKQKYLLVIGTFHSSSNAIAFVRTAKAKGLKTEMLYSQETGYYYVYAPEYDREDPTVEDLLQIREKIPFKDAWYKSGLKK